VAPQYPRLQQAFQRIIEATVPSMAEELQPELDQLFDKEKNPFTENQVRRLRRLRKSRRLRGLAPHVRPLVSLVCMTALKGCMLLLCVCVCAPLKLVLIFVLVLGFGQDLVEAINQVRFERFDRVLHQVCLLSIHGHRPHFCWARPRRAFSRVWQQSNAECP